MTVSSETKRADYNGNGSTVIFTVPFYFLEDSHIAVYLLDAAGVETQQVLNTDYTVTDAGVPTGGSITMTVAPAVGEAITIIRDVPLTQGKDYIAHDTFPAESHEQALDKLTMLFQQFSEAQDRSVLAAPTNQVNIVLPSANAGKALLWNAAQDNLENSAENFNDIVPDAQAAQVAAEAAQTAAETAQTNAETAETNAETAETNAETAETNALTSENKAHDWAEEDEDVEVEVGEYSAHHWALKAQAMFDEVGAVKMWPINSVPSGYLECNGASLDRTTYAALFAILGTTYGNVDGSHFNLPDLRGQFIRGWDHSAGTDPSAATRSDRGDGVTGDHVGTTQEQDVIDHNHSGTTNSDAHTHNVRVYGSGNPANTVGKGLDAGQTDISAAALSDSHTHTFTTNIDGHNTVNETRPININMMFIIKY